MWGFLNFLLWILNDVVDLACPATLICINFPYSFSVPTRYIYLWTWKKVFLHSVMLGSSFIFFHLMLGVTHLLLEKDFSSANFELNSGTIEIRCKIFKAFSRYTRAACADDDHSWRDSIPTRVFTSNFHDEILLVIFFKPS